MPCRAAAWARTRAARHSFCEVKRSKELSARLYAALRRALAYARLSAGTGQGGGGHSTDGDLPLLCQGDWSQHGPQRAGGCRLPVGIGAARRAARARPRLHRQGGPGALGNHAAGRCAGAVAGPGHAVERGGSPGAPAQQPVGARRGDQPAAGARACGGSCAGARFRAGAVRVARDGGGPECALGRGVGRRGAAARARHADDAAGGG